MRRGFALLLVLSAACASSGDVRPVTISDGTRSVTVLAEVADEPDEWRRGYIGRPTAEPGTGILFLFDVPGPRSFHMRGVLIDLDLISIKAGRVVAVTRMTACPEADCTEDYPTPDLDAALEVPAGSLGGLGVGSSVRGL